jgi:hypothetical protein
MWFFLVWAGSGLPSSNHASRFFDAIHDGKQRSDYITIGAARLSAASREFGNFTSH